MDPFAKQSQSLDRLVAEYEPDVPVGNLIAPASHRGGRNLLLEQPIGNVHAVELEGCDIQEQRPTARGPHDGEPLELPERLVATSLPFGIGPGQILVSHAK